MLTDQDFLRIHQSTSVDLADDTDKASRVIAWLTEYGRAVEAKVREQIAERKSQWIPASDQLPTEDDGEVLVRMQDGTCEIAWATYWHGASNAFAGWTFRDPDETREPTHWMPPPPPPITQENE